MNIAVRQVKNRVLSARGKIARHPRAGDRGEKRKRMSQRNVFAKRDEMGLAINLHLLAGLRDEQRRVVIVPFFKIERPEHQIRFCRCRKIGHETMALGILIAHRIGH